MTKYLVVTTCSAKQWDEYGSKMVSTFIEYWPEEVEFRLYPEGFFAETSQDLCQASPWLAEFKKKHSSPQFKGGADGRDYRRDAVRFAHKVAAIDLAAKDESCDVLIWMDADIITFAPVTVEWLDSLFPDSATVGWLDRVGTYPECGFLMFRMPKARGLLKHVVQMYTGGGIFALSETHDSFVFQHVITREAGRHQAKIHSLSGNGRVHTGHPFVNSRLAERMDHLKGELRKARGTSLPKDVKESRSESYWKKVRSGA